MKGAPIEASGAGDLWMGGANCCGLREQFNGRIDDVAIFNRALSEKEVPEAGEIVNLGWVRDIELSVDESQTPGMSWLPDSAGTYTAEVYVWDSLTSAVALSPVKSTSFTVG